MPTLNITNQNLFDWKDDIEGNLKKTIDAFCKKNNNCTQLTINYDIKSLVAKNDDELITDLSFDKFMDAVEKDKRIISKTLGAPAAYQETSVTFFPSSPNNAKPAQQASPVQVADMKHK